jgi:hypothetical protein
MSAVAWPVPWKMMASSPGPSLKRKYRENWRKKPQIFATEKLKLQAIHYSRTMRGYMLDLQDYFKEQNCKENITSLTKFTFRSVKLQSGSRAHGAILSHGCC